MEDWSVNKITLQQIEIFLTVAEQLNLSEAARDLFINQSAVSRWLSRLEENLDTTLFIRTNRGVELTAHGEFLYTELKPLYERLTEVTKSLSRVYPTEEDILRIGCMDSSEVIGAMKPLLKRFEKRCPDTLIKLEPFSCIDLREALACNRLDCVVSYHLGFSECLSIQHKKIKKLETYIAVSASGPLADSFEIPVDKLNDETLYLLYITEMKDAEFRAIEICQEIGFMPKEIVYMPNYFALELAIKNGKGFTISGSNICERFGTDIKTYHVPKPYRVQYVIAAWRKNRCSPLTKIFLDLIDDVL